MALTDTLCRLMADGVADIAAILAITAYRHGDGALANVAIDRALAAEPDHRLANLAAEILQVGMPPHQLDHMADMIPTG